MLKYHKNLLPSLIILASITSASMVYASSTQVKTQVHIQGASDVMHKYPEPPEEIFDVNPKMRHSKEFEARELKVQIRELASQLLETYSNEVLSGTIAVPTSFTNLDNFEQTSALGRYFSEAMMYEFNLRAYPVLEYRLDDVVTISNQGELVLTRNLPPLKYGTNERNDVLLVGTYYVDENAVLVNARLVKPNGLVIRTAQMVLPMTGLLARMTTLPPEPEPVALPALSAGSLKVRRK